MHCLNYLNNNTFFINKRERLIDYRKGILAGLPIALGYIPVSFTFGLMAVNGGIPVWLLNDLINEPESADNLQV